MPPELDEIDDERLAWASFSALNQAINKILGDPKEVVSEREAFLLRELQLMLESQGLTEDFEDMVIVAARNAWREYQETHADICQPSRSFRRVSRFGFDVRSAIASVVPQIIESHERVLMEKGIHSARLGSVRRVAHI